MEDKKCDNKKYDNKKYTYANIVDQMERNKFLSTDYPKMCKTYEYIPAILPKVERIVVLGDIHGDYQLTMDMLIKAKLINNATERKWIGGSSYVLQVGDQIDRCRPIRGLKCDNPKTTLHDEANDITILELFNDLHKQASQVGGKVISLLGNHEILNSLGCMDYVSRKGLEQFANYVDPVNPNVTFTGQNHIEKGKNARIHAFKPGNHYGVMLGCSRVPSIIIGSNLFVHAGIVDALIKEIDLRGIEDLESINISIRKWLLGLVQREDVDHLIQGSKYSMFWTRILGRIPPNTSLQSEVCSKHIGKALQIFQINGMIIGHTPQSFLHSHDINSTCSGKVWRVDNGSSCAFDGYDPITQKTGSKSHGRRTQWLEIRNDNEYYVCDGINAIKQA